LSGDDIVSILGGRKGTYERGLQLTSTLSHERYTRSTVDYLSMFLFFLLPLRSPKTRETQTIMSETINIPSEAFTIKRDGEDLVGNGVTNANCNPTQRSVAQLNGQGDQSHVGRIMTLSNVGSYARIEFSQPVSLWAIKGQQIHEKHGKAQLFCHRPTN